VIVGNFIRHSFDLKDMEYTNLILACVTNPPIPSPATLRCTYGVFLGNFGGWPYGATTATVLQQFLFSRRRGAVQGTGQF
jgi:hypothetical protein